MAFLGDAGEVRVRVLQLSLGRAGDALKGRHGFRGGALAACGKSGQRQSHKSSLVSSKHGASASCFDTRDLDKSQPDMNCGTHIITGGTGKYSGITGKEPFSCISKAAPDGAPAGSFAMDIPHNTTWEIKG